MRPLLDKCKFCVKQLAVSMGLNVTSKHVLLPQKINIRSTLTLTLCSFAHLSCRCEVLKAGHPPLLNFEPISFAVRDPEGRAHQPWLTGTKQLTN